MKQITLFFVFITNIGFGQTTNLVDLGIVNITQDTQIWCWAAVSQQIIYWKKGVSPKQCELVAIANNANPNICCYNYQQCMVAGGLNQIQNLLAYFGSSYSSLAPPTTPDVLYNTLKGGKAIILQLQLTPYMGHVVVLRGMDWVQTQNGLQPVLLINDPMNHFTQPILFENIIRYWKTAIVVY
jgi:hypothetical protein